VIAVKPHDELNYRIMAERTTSLEQLSSPERELAAQDTALRRTLAENRALKRLRPAADAPPARAVMLEQVYRTADQQEEPRMTIINRLFSGKRWYVQAGLAAVLLIALGVLALLPSRPSWGAVNGYVLSYDLGAIPPEQLQTTLNDDLMPQVKSVLEQFKADHAAQLGGPDEELEIMVAIEAGEDSAVLSIGLTLDDPELQEALKAALATVPGLPEPSLTPSTWFFEGGKLSAGGVKVQVNDHLFSFPPGTSAEEMEEQITAWLTEQDPDAEAKVSVDITDEGDQRKIRIEIGCEDCEDGEHGKDGGDEK
jgi:hypothetical protein